LLVIVTDQGEAIKNHFIYLYMKTELAKSINDFLFKYLCGTVFDLTKEDFGFVNT
jgi:hypothetical protein